MGDSQLSFDLKPKPAKRQTPRPLRPLIRRQGAETIGETFAQYHADHPEIYSALVRLARTATAAGKMKIGIKALWERCRWELEVETAGEFKLNNNLTSRYARLIMDREPDLAGVFEIRGLKSE